MRLVSGKASARFLVDPDLCVWARKKSVDLATSASDLSELGLRIVKAIIEGPDGAVVILDFLQLNNPEAATRLRGLLEKVKG